jgi:hypothetical protein
LRRILNFIKRAASFALSASHGLALAHGVTPVDLTDELFLRILNITESLFCFWSSLGGGQRADLSRFDEVKFTTPSSFLRGEGERLTPLDCFPEGLCFMKMEEE